jgi:hypothetical protein
VLSASRVGLLTVLRYFFSIFGDSQPAITCRTTRHWLTKAQLDVTGFAGLTWRLKIEEVNHEVCFKLRNPCRSLSVYTLVITSPAPRGVLVTRTSVTPAICRFRPSMLSWLYLLHRVIPLLVLTRQDKPQVSQSVSDTTAENTK